MTYCIGDRGTRDYARFSVRIDFRFAEDQPLAALEQLRIRNEVARTWLAQEVNVHLVVTASGAQSTAESSAPCALISASCMMTGLDTAPLEVRNAFTTR